MFITAVCFIFLIRTFLVSFVGISGEFGRAMVRILARRSRAKIPMARPNEHDMPPKRTKKVWLGNSIVSVWLFKYFSTQLASVF